MERLAPPGTGLKGNFDATYLAALKTVRNSLLSAGGGLGIGVHDANCG